jgi:NAD(P)H-nitrite reductase large subunit
VISNENYAYYKRSQIIQLISKSCTEEELFIEGINFYKEIGANFLNDHVTKVLPEKNQVLLKDSSIITYDSLLIASGGRPIVIPWKNVNLKGISTLYTLNNAKKVANLACNAKAAVIIGGGSIAMKVVKNLLTIGIDVSIIEKSSHLWPIGFDRKVARIIENKLKENKVKLYLNEEVVRFNGENGKVSSLTLRNQQNIPCDLAIITIGMKPNIDYLKNSGLVVDKGIIVDKFMKTNISNIFAAGDVAQTEDPLYDTPLLHPTWGNAKKQGKIAANNMVGNITEYSGTIPIQSIKILGFRALTVGITHSKKFFDEISWISFKNGFCRKFVFNNNRLVGALFLGKNLNKKKLKPLIKKAVFNMVDVSRYKTELLNEDFDFSKIISNKKS